MLSVKWTVTVMVARGAAAMSAWKGFVIPRAWAVMGVFGEGVEEKIQQDSG